MKKPLLFFLISALLFSACREPISENEILEPTIAHTKGPTFTPTQQPSRITEIDAELELVLPPKLAWDFYPGGITRKELLSQLPEATEVKGYINRDETWSGTIHVIGDIQINSGATLTIQSGTIIFITARIDYGHIGPRRVGTDQFNPKDPQYDGAERVEIWVYGDLIISGTKDDPVIFTSDAENPLNDDWGGFNISPQSKTDINRTIIEFNRRFGIGSSDVRISQSIIRNMMEAITIGDIKPDTTLETVLELKPEITQSYIYNMGRHAITVRAGSPTISHNVIIGRFDMDTTGWEQGAIGTDFPSCAIIHHNYLDGGTPRKYDGEVHGDYKLATQPKSIGIFGLCGSLEYNTLIGSPVSLEIHSIDYKIENNNFLPMQLDKVYENYEYFPKQNSNTNVSCLFVSDWSPEESDQWQIELIGDVGGLDTDDIINVQNNYWGTENSELIEECIWNNDGASKVVFDPYKDSFIDEALPDLESIVWE